MLMCYKKQGQSEQFVRIFIIFATTRYDNYNSRYLVFLNNKSATPHQECRAYCYTQDVAPSAVRMAESRGQVA